MQPLPHELSPLSDANCGDELFRIANVVHQETPERIISDVGRRIAEARRARGWTQQQAAEKLKMEVQSVQRIERGRENMTIRTLVGIARTFGVVTRTLFEPPTTRERKPGRPKKGA
ncbi:MAG: helix-turn-helix transcriptional regulator [Pseudomonadota bacterium]